MGQRGGASGWGKGVEQVGWGKGVEQVGWGKGVEQVGWGKGVGQRHCCVIQSGLAYMETLRGS